MKKKDATAELDAVQGSIRRWQTRLVRVTNMLTKLERKRRRLESKKAAPVAALPQKPKPEQPKATVVPPPDDLTVIAEAVKTVKDSGLDFPAFLDRRNPVVAEQMTKARRAAEVAERSKMPLTGKAALEAIRPKRKAK